MSQIRINTSQNVEIERTAANVGIRIVSQIIDYIILFIYFMFIIFISYLIKSESLAFFLICLIPAFFYSFIMESAFQGQSVAKMILKIKVVKLDGSQPSILNFFIRWIFRLIDTPFYGIVAIISISTSGKGQRLGDKAAGTTVISLQKKYDLKNSIYRSINEEYKLQFPQVELLKEEDINTVNEVLNHYNGNSGTQARELLIKTKSAIILKTGIDTQIESLPFLRTIVKDYNYMIRNEDY
jgi:uncharacterized RDD family membrane protein YckC